jgi:hypothetical protein
MAQSSPDPESCEPESSDPPEVPDPDEPELEEPEPDEPLPDEPLLPEPELSESPEVPPWSSVVVSLRELLFFFGFPFALGASGLGSPSAGAGRAAGVAAIVAAEER